MGGITMWVILGSLIGLVAVFLIVTSVLDRRKMRRLKAKNAVVAEQVAAARVQVLLFVEFVIKKNEQLLASFVPSVGQLKMADIKGRAREALKKLRHTPEFGLLDNDDDEIKKVKQNINELIAQNANIWNRTEAATFIHEALADVDRQSHAAYLAALPDRLKEIYA